MIELLFSGSQDNFKISTVNENLMAVRVTMENDLSDAEASRLEINLGYEDIKMLSEWVRDLEYKFQELQKKTSNAAN